MSVNVTPGSGVVVAADIVGSASAPATGQAIQYVKLDFGTAGNSSPVTTTNPLPVQLTDGTNTQKSASAANLALKSAQNAALVEAPGQWAVTSAPAVNTQATISQAAGGAGVRNVAQALAVTLANDGTGSVQAGLLFNLRDGATGAGTILWSITLSVIATAGAFSGLSVSGLNIPGTANTAMTLESASAPGAHTAASVSLAGTTSV